MGVVEPGIARPDIGVSFNHLAPHYRWLEAVVAGPVLQRCRTALLDEVRAAGHVLVLGPGRGRFVRPLLAVNPGGRITLIDSSERMLECLCRDMRGEPAFVGRVKTVHGDILKEQYAPGTFDAVVSHFFLDCFAPAQLEAVIAQVSSWTTPGARWLVSDFAMPRRGWTRWRARVIHAAMYGAFRTVTDISARRLTPPDLYLGRAGFALSRRVSSNFGLLQADLWVRGHDGAS